MVIGIYCYKIRGLVLRKGRKGESIESIFGRMFVVDVMMGSICFEVV